jgi:2'-5' RNA ligase
VFFALGPDPVALPGLGDLQRRLLPLCRGRRVRPVIRANLHVTLAFSGDRTDEEIEALLAAAPTIELPDQPILARTGRVLGFPRPERPRVVALELESDGAIEHLAEQVGACMDAIGCPRDRRPFRAHLTLVRMNSGRLHPGSTDPVPVPLTTLALLASRPGPSGVRYEPLWSADLSSAASMR